MLTGRSKRPEFECFSGIGQEKSPRTEAARCRSFRPIAVAAHCTLKAGFPIGKYSHAEQVILTAFQQYGVILTDAGQSGTIYTGADVTEEPTAMAALKELASSNNTISFSNFEAVDESSFLVNPNSAEVNPTNDYETPNGYAVVTATDQANPASTSMVQNCVESDYPIVASPTLYTVAGTPGHVITAGYRASHYSAVHWSPVSGVGSITTNGTYTPPATVSVPSSAMVHDAGNDPNEMSTVYTAVLPPGTNPTGSVRIDVGSSSSTKAANGNVWQADQAFQMGTLVQLGGEYPAWLEKSNPEINIYLRSSHTYGDDMLSNFVVGRNGDVIPALSLGATNFQFANAFRGGANVSTKHV